MRTLFVFLTLAILRSRAQDERNRRPFDNGSGFEVKLAVPGKPGNDYPIFDQIPRTSFTCSGKEPGYYADMETNCQVFRVCTFGSTFGYQSFLCPNGTLFNQAVYVCDWWMNVNCTKSKELYNYKSELLDLRKGPHFMRDIKKMITHPMRNPYDQNFAKDRLIIIQNYQPPNNPFNSISKHDAKKNSSKIIPQVKENIYSTTDISTTTSKPTTYYYSNFNIFPTSNKSYDSVRQQSQKPFPQEKVGTNYKQRLFSNSHSGQTLPNKTTNVLSYTKDLQNIVKPTQSNQKVQKFLNHHHTQAHSSQENRLVINSQQSYPTQNTLSNNQSKVQLNRHILQDRELYSYKYNQARFSKDIRNQVDIESAQNLVNNDTSPTLIRKTLAFREIIKDPKNGTPRSKITFKTWILRPSKNEKLSAEPTPYTYNTPKITIVDDNDSNVISNTSEESEDQTNLDLEPYQYNPPTSPSALTYVTTTEIPLPTITSFKPSEPTKPSLLYLPPTTYKTPSLLYNFPTDNIQTQRQYLLPEIVQSPLIELGSSPVPFIQSLTNVKKPAFPLRKELTTKINHNNNLFSDTLLKNNLDITVKDLLKDTTKLFRTISSNNIYGLKQEIQTIDYPDENYLPQNIQNQGHDKTLLQPHTELSINSKLIATPSIVLEPPDESYEYSLKKPNKLSYLSFIKQPSLSTIERTVSIKITMPQKIADFIFKKNVSNNLEILSTENTNSFVVANKMPNKKDSHQYVPIGKLVWSNSSEMSPSHELLFSFLADSISAAQEYNNIAKQANFQPIPTHFTYLNKNKIGSLSDRIAQITSEQFSNIKPSSNHQFSRRVNPNHLNNDLLTRRYQQVETDSSKNYHPKKSQQEPINAKQITDNHLSEIDSNVESIYSGQLYQLPVPEVTKQFYNFQAQTKGKNSLNYERENIENKYKYSQPELKMTKSQILSPEPKLSKQNQESIDQKTTAYNFEDTILIPSDRVAAQIHDNTIGIIPHPLHKDKLINYKKDHIYYIYTQLNDTDIDNFKKDNILNRPFISRPNSKLSELIDNIIPSIKYDLETDTEKQTTPNILQEENLGIQSQEIGADINYIIHHPETGKPFDKPYQGPSSYNAPQAIVGNLEFNKNSIELNEDIEKIDNYENNGYPKLIPTKRFSFR